MKDRVPANPGRVLITPENGSAPFYATMTRADNPTQEGDPLNKNTLLKDATAALFGLTEDAVPDDVLSVIKGVLNNNTNDISALKVSGAKLETGSYVGTGSTTNTLQFSNNPQIVIITDGTAGINPIKGWTDGSGIILVRTQTFAVVNTNSRKVTFSGNTLTLTDNSDAKYVYNRSGLTYHYWAIS